MHFFGITKHLTALLIDIVARGFAENGLHRPIENHNQRIGVSRSTQACDQGLGDLIFLSSRSVNHLLVVALDHDAE